MRLIRANAARYAIEGDLKDPAFTVNPLSMLTPGPFRRLFDGFSSRNLSEAEATPVQPGSRPPARRIDADGARPPAAVQQDSRPAPLAPQYERLPDR